MGCFIVCLGFSKKRKRRIRPANKLISGDQIYGSYKHLDSQDVTQEDSAIVESDCSSQANVNSSIKIKKKVTFNLNVKIYEPIPEETSYSSDKELGSENVVADKDKESNNVSYPPNYRYQNLRDCWDDEDEDEESDDLDDDDDDWEENEEDDNEEEEEICRHLCCLSVESEAKTPTIEENDKVGYRERGQYKCSVLNPVENLTQWRELKGKCKKHPLLKMQLTKEDMGMIMGEKQEEVKIRASLNLSPKCKLSSPLIQDIAIDASLSHWVLASSAREFAAAQQC